MIKFFRKIRQKLIEGGDLKRYLIYAIGEILLVMIGILLALQVNNWNESNRLSRSEITYLKEIRNDLVKDTLSLSLVISNFKTILSNFKSQDSTIHSQFDHALGQLPAAEIKNDIGYFFRTNPPFRPKQGTYKSLISEGKSSIITNRLLFNELQGVYEDEYLSLERIDNTVWDKSVTLNAKYAYEVKYEDFGSPVNIRNKQILADIQNSYGLHSLYAFRCVSVKNILKDLISSLDLEIESLQ